MSLLIQHNVPSRQPSVARTLERLSSGHGNGPENTATAFEIMERMRQAKQDIALRKACQNDLFILLEQTKDVLEYLNEKLGLLRELTEQGLSQPDPAAVAACDADYQTIKKDIEGMLSHYSHLPCQPQPAKDTGGLVIQFGSGDDTAETLHLENRDCSWQALGIAASSLETPEKNHAAHTAVQAALEKVNEARSYFMQMQGKLLAQSNL